MLPAGHKLQILADDERRRAYEMIRSKATNGVQAKGSFKEIATHFVVHQSTVRRIWQRGIQSLSDGAICANVSAKRKCRAMKKRSKVNAMAIQEVPSRQRTTIRSLAQALGVPKSSHDRFKNGELQRYSNAIKPLLTGKKEGTPEVLFVNGRDERANSNFS